MAAGASRVRNLCILAHVDHGKTTLADALVASNGIISKRMAGKLRYMDSRPDEQERGITMKSSAVTLTYEDQLDEEAEDSYKKTYLINLIDSPGHVDFSSEVSTAVRLCDGALLVVDVVEGVQPQTKVVLAQAWREGIRPMLVLNKIDRLITETKLEPLDAYLRLRGVMEQVNAVIGELFAADVMSGGHGPSLAENSHREEEGGDKDEEGFDWSTGLDDADDSELYFAPEHGNVVFASAYDGWAFDLATFAAIFARKLGFSRRALTKTLWGDFFVNAKAKRIQKGAAAKGKKPLFVQLILENIWAVYDAAVFRMDKERLMKIAESLQVKVAARDLRSTDAKQQVTAILSQWLPLAPTVLRVACRKLPAPTELTEERVAKLMCPQNKRFDALPPETKALTDAFLRCSSSAESPVIVFVSKMFPVPAKSLPKNRPKPLSEAEMAERRERAKERMEAARRGEEDSSSAGVTLSSEAMERLKVESMSKQSSLNEEETDFIAFARVFSGSLKPGNDIYVLGPKHDPALALSNKANAEPYFNEGANVHDNAEGWSCFKAAVGELYMLAGRDLQELSEAPAGSVVGIGGLQNYILKSATLASDVACPPFVETTASVAPILRVALEPELSTDLPRLEKGLALLNQADANVQVSITDKGEHILVSFKRKRRTFDSGFLR